jgi:dienelactone hydrolase
MHQAAFMQDGRKAKSQRRCRRLSVGALLLLLFQFVDCFNVKPHDYLSSMGQAKAMHRRNRILLRMNDFDDDGLFSKEESEALTVPQLKQQLRLRGLKVSGKKQELLDRLFNSSTKWAPSAIGKEDDSTPLNGKPQEPEVIAEQKAKATKKTKAQKFAEEKGKEFIDVTAYLDDEDEGENVKTSVPVEKDGEDNPQSQNPEVWGSAAKIVDDYEGRTPIVDGLSRTVVEFTGSNKTQVQAFVVASRDALKPFLAGGQNRTDEPEERLREIQVKRELASKRPLRQEEEEGLDEGDEPGNYKDIMHRDFTDWGKYSLTGAQISAQEVQGVLLLSDAHGAFSDDTRTLAEKIAFECQPVVVMVPDLFRGKPWKEDPTTPGFNEEGQDYEEWRAQHPENRVSIDIRASAAVLRAQYGVSSIVVWGTCYGGGRALEVGAGYIPGGKVHDVDGAIGPVPVNPEVVVAWYPTKYNSKGLFGSTRPKGLFDASKDRNMAVIAVFAGEDKLPGATADDAAELKSVLEEDERVKDYMVKIFPNQGHGFAHIGMGRGREDTDLDRFVDDEFGGSGRVFMEGGDAEVACLLSTAFMETYSRMFLPTAGPPISKDELASEWTESLTMKDFTKTTRDVREELAKMEEGFVEEPLGGKMMDPTDESQQEDLVKILRGMEPENMPAELKIQDDDDIETIYAKLKAGDDSFQLF